MKKFLTLLPILGFYCVSAQDTTTVKKPAVYFDIHAGTGMRLGEKAPSDNFMVNNYSEQLRNGFQFDAALFVEVAPKHLIGFRYNSWRKKAGIRAGESSITDDITLSLYGVGYMFAKQGTANSQWSVDGGFGLMTYRDRAVVSGEDIDIKGSTLGAFVGAAYYFKIVKGLYFGPRINLMVGAINKIKVEGDGPSEEIDLENPESLSRLDVSLGLRIKL